MIILMKNSKIHGVFILLLATVFYCIDVGSQDLQVIELRPEHSATGISQNTQSGFRITQSLSSVNFKRQETGKGAFTMIYATGQNSATVHGSPLLPVISRLIEIPSGAEVEYRIVSYREELLDLSSYGIDAPLFPRQPSLPKSIDIRDDEFVYRHDLYSRDEFLGEELVSIEEIGIMRGRRIGRIQISPVQYNPVRNRVRVISEIEIEVLFKAGGAETESSGPAFASPFYEQAFARKLLNYREDRTKTYFSGGPLKYIILSHPGFKEDLREFVNWKTMKGFNVIELYRGTDGVGETPGEMRDTLASIYHSSTADDPAPVFLLIVGDHSQIPAFQSTGHITDLYYAEYDGDDDYLPDLFYGRFSANNSDELLPQIQKTLIYEKYLFPDAGFLNESVLIAGFDARHAEVHGNGQINYGTTYYFNQDFGINAHAFPVPHEAGVEDDIISRISDGAGFVNYTGHGISSRWDNPRFTIDDIPSLDNYGKYPLMIGNGCETVRFEIYETLGEALLRADGKGAVGYIGASNDSYWDEDFYWAVGAGPISANPVREETGPGFFDRLFHTDIESPSEWYVSQGQIQQAGNLAVSESATRGRTRYYWEIYHLLGDPSLMVYFSEPDILSPVYSDVVPSVSSGLVVETEPYTYIALSGGGELVDARYSGNNGVARLVFDSLDPGVEYNLVATRENRQPYMGPVKVAPSSQPYILLKSFTVDDQMHNNNGIAEAGEGIYLNMVIRNEGDLPAESIRLSIASDNRHITLYDTSAYIDLLEPEAEVEVNGVLGFDISPLIPDGESLFLTLEVYSKDTLAWINNFALDVNAPQISILRYFVDNPEGQYPGGYLMAGETAGLVVEFSNKGSATIYNAQVILSEDSGMLTFQGDGIYHGDIMPGDTVHHHVVITANDTIEYDTRLDIEMETLSVEFESLNEFSFRANTIYEDFEDGEFGRRPWRTDSVKGWFFSSDASGGRYSIRSGIIDHSESSELQIRMEVASEGVVTFDRKVSSEARYDFLNFYIDDEKVGSWSGLLNWAPEQFEVKPGNRVFRWVYTKDQSVSKGLDAAFIDDVRFPPGNLVDDFSNEIIAGLSIEELISPVSGEWSPDNQPVTFLVRNNGNRTVSSFTAGWELDDEPPVKETFESDMKPGESAQFTFAELADLRRPGFYDLVVYIMDDIDGSHQNDTLYMRIEVPEVHDISITELLQPQSGYELGEEEVVEIEIVNNGNVGLTGFEVGYILNPANAVTEVFDGLIEPGQSAKHVFDHRADMSDEVLYHLILFVHLTHGSETVSDTMIVEVEKIVSGTHSPVNNDELVLIYPNPFNYDLYIQKNHINAGRVNIRLITSTGKTVLYKSSAADIHDGVLRIDGAGLLPGIYFLEFSSEGISKVFRVIRF